MQGADVTVTVAITYHTPHDSTSPHQEIVSYSLFLLSQHQSPMTAEPVVVVVEEGRRN